MDSSFACLPINHLSLGWLHITNIFAWAWIVPGGAALTVPHPHQYYNNRIGAVLTSMTEKQKQPSGKTLPGIENARTDFLASI